MSEPIEYKIKDLIWAKMKGFPPWPAMIVDPPEDMLHQPRKNVATKCVYFFGTRNFIWMEENNIIPFEGPHKDELMLPLKPNAFRHALADIQAYIENPAQIEEYLKLQYKLLSIPK